MYPFVCTYVTYTSYEYTKWLTCPRNLILVTNLYQSWARPVWARTILAYHVLIRQHIPNFKLKNQLKIKKPELSVFSSPFLRIHNQIMTHAVSRSIDVSSLACMPGNLLVKCFLRWVIWHISTPLDIVAITANDGGAPGGKDATILDWKLATFGAIFVKRVDNI